MKLTKGFKVTFLAVLTAMIVFIGQGIVIATPPQSNVLTAQTDESAAIRKVMLSRLPKNSSVDELFISNQFALAGWISGEAGGTALLSKKTGTWKILTSGGGVLGINEMLDNKVPRQTAEKLLQARKMEWERKGYK